jgi:chaperonin GroEL
MLAGCDKLADAVQVTMGPKGRNVVIEQSYGAPKITKDGVTVAKNIEFSDRFMNLGASLVKQVASATNDVAGDGTTTATVLTRAIFSEGCKSVAAGMNPMDLRRGIQSAVDVVVSELKNSAKLISTTEEIAQVGTISANGEREIGELIARAMEKVGKEGVITVADGKTLENELEVVEGMKFERGYISPYFVTNAKTQKCELENPYVLVFEKKISGLTSLLPVLEAVLKTQRPLLIVAEDVESEALATLIVNKLRGGVKICAVKAPGFGDNRKANLQDIAILTGGVVVSEDLGYKLEAVDVSMLGTAKKITVSKDDTIILDGAGGKDAIEERCEQLREAIAETSSDYDREKMSERLAKLSGGVAVLKIGGASEVEVGEKKDRVVDALNATKAAVDEGIVAGGGTALLSATKKLDALEASMANFDQKVGVQIIRAALKIPVRTIATNAGVEGSVVVEKVLASTEENWGYDAATGQYGCMIKAGVIDPLKVVRTALVDAASVSSLMMTSECMITEGPPDPATAAAANMGGYGGGMGGMGGMGF